MVFHGRFGHQLEAHMSSSTSHFRSLPFCRVINTIMLLIVLSIFIAPLAGCGGGEEDRPPQAPIVSTKPFTNAEAVAQRYLAAPPLLELTEYNGVANSDGTIWVTIRHGQNIVYDKRLGVSDFDLLTGTMYNGTLVYWVTEYVPYDPPIEVVIVGGKKFELPQLRVTRDGTSRKVLFYDIKEGLGDWLTVYGEEILHAGDQGDPRQLWAALNIKTGEFLEFGEYAVPELLDPPEPEIPVPTTAEEASEIWEDQDYIIFSRNDPFVQLADGRFQAIIIAGDGKVIYDRTVADYRYQEGATSDGTMLRLIVTNAGSTLIVGDRAFPIAFDPRNQPDGLPKAIIPQDVSEGAGPDWLILYSELLDGEIKYPYWALINRHTGELVELGYYDDSSNM